MGGDTTLWGLRASDGHVMAYNYSSAYWSDLLIANGHGLDIGGTIKFVYVGDATHILGITNYQTGKSNTYTWNGSNWAHVGGNDWDCLEGAIDSNNDIWCIGNTHQVYKLVSGTWTSQSGFLYSISVTACTPVPYVFGICSGNTLYGLTSSGWNGISPTNLGFTPSEAPGAVSGGCDGSLIVLDTGNQIHISEDGGGTWTTVYGGAVWVSSPILAGAVIVGASNKVYHYTGLMPSLTQSTTGSDQACPGCNPPGYHDSECRQAKSLGPCLYL
jgi:hypothetical protein